uniref:Uncharacterized protein n=1 Tax=Glossina palpalis gambiensis TaxID=67801 RepID=A0A1B0B017_9MUSC
MAINCSLTEMVWCNATVVVYSLMSLLFIFVAKAMIREEDIKISDKGQGLITFAISVIKFRRKLQRLSKCIQIHDWLSSVNFSNITTGDLL